MGPCLRQRKCGRRTGPHRLSSTSHAGRRRHRWNTFQHSRLSIRRAIFLTNRSLSRVGAHQWNHQTSMLRRYELSCLAARVPTVTPTTRVTSFHTGASTLAPLPFDPIQCRRRPSWDHVGGVVSTQPLQRAGIATRRAVVAAVPPACVVGIISAVRVTPSIMISEPIGTFVSRATVFNKNR